MPEGAIGSRASNSRSPFPPSSRPGTSTRSGPGRRWTGRAPPSPGGRPWGITRAAARSASGTRRVSLVRAACEGATSWVPEACSAAIVASARVLQTPASRALKRQPGVRLAACRRASSQQGRGVSSSSTGQNGNASCSTRLVGSPVESTSRLVPISEETRTAPTPKLAMVSSNAARTTGCDRPVSPSGGSMRQCRIGERSRAVCRARP